MVIKPVVHMEQIPKHLRRKPLGNGSTGKPGIGEKRVEGALQVSDMRANPARNQVGDRFLEENASLLGLVHQNGYPGFKIRGFNRHRQAPAKPGSQARLNAVHFLGITVTGQNYLLLTIQQRIESMEKFFLGAVFAGKELDIVYKQGIGGSVVLFE